MAIKSIKSPGIIALIFSPAKFAARLYLSFGLDEIKASAQSMESARKDFDQVLEAKVASDRNAANLHRICARAHELISAGKTDDAEKVLRAVAAMDI